jgi:hypothetical protein
MRAAGRIAAIVVGLIVLTGVLAVVGSGSDNTGDTVRASQWADDVCGTVGTWQGELKDLREDLGNSTYGARESDGGSGDAVEHVVYLRSILPRLIVSTEDTLQRGLERAGIPDADNGKEAALILRTWAVDTENKLRTVNQTLKRQPKATSSAFESLALTVGALGQSAVDGRAAFKKVQALDPALADAIGGSRNCDDLMKEQP